MSELIDKRSAAQTVRWRLLTTVSALTLLAAGTARQARAEDGEHPTIWIELGGQLESVSGGRETYVPPFVGAFDYLNFEPVLPLQRPPRYAFGGEGKISFEPRGSDWVLSAGVRYGRSNGKKANYQRVVASVYQIGNKQLTQTRIQNPPDHLDASSETAESHAILDFKVGKDVGLGLFSGKGDSVFSLGVRFAQFTSARNEDLNGVPDRHHVGSLYKYSGFFRSNHHYSGIVDTENSFHGLGPSLSWDASARLVDRGDDGGITLDWGINAAALFGRQKVKGENNVTGLHYKSFFHWKNALGAYTRYNGVASSYHHNEHIDRTRSVVVPNLGGFAGVSLKFPNAKVSLGYRADFFFGAMDGGIDTRKAYDRNFYGPFATISIGLGG